MPDLVVAPGLRLTGWRQSDAGHPFFHQLEDEVGLLVEIVLAGAGDDLMIELCRRRSETIHQRRIGTGRDVGQNQSENLLPPVIAL